ncbi:amino acid permease [Dysgonomonas sp. 521]|uniref:amino acid permease n=1 Tax=Dysgonomonas sp. 521 TaxID=2302932 RepID=UPI0013D2A309|nr:amino acid permease [Dysgonomonas sp. 521]NDV94668.1 amino acid permease [Dysgonomonas sp. 521]
MNLNSFIRKKSIDSISREGDSIGSGMKRVLGVRDLTLFGIAAIVGAGIFSTIGRAAFHGGPAVSLLFVFVAIACVFTALCYAQFASMISVSGSAYTYTYVSLGEIFAWVIGWALILEYAVSNMVIAISWSEYFTTLLQGFGVDWPDWLAIGYSTAHKAYNTVLQGGADLPAHTLQAAETYRNAPELFGTKILINLPAGLVVTALTFLVFLGIKESKMVNNLLVFLKIGIILAVILIGAFFVKPENWSPFAPNGVQGVLGGVAAVFFAFIGFDSISTTAEESKNPQRDMPRAMLYCLGICTVLYVAIALVLTGMVSYKELGVDDPLAYVFQLVDMNFVAGVISFTAIIAITSAILVFQIGQPRIWMTMSRDGLLWPKFAKIHPKYKTPSFSTIITGVLVCIPSLFLDMQFVVDLTSVGTFFAFILVCAGVLFLDHKGESKKAKFKVPYINGQYIIFILLVVAVYLFISKTDAVEVITRKPLLLIFWAVWLGLAIAAFKYRFSLLPIMGILTNLYLMTELGWSNWIMFLIWLAIGLIIYLAYGYRKSKLARQTGLIK